LKSTIVLVYPGYGLGTIGVVYCPGVHSGEEEEEYYGRKKFDYRSCQYSFQMNAEGSIFWVDGRNPNI